MITQQTADQLLAQLREARSRCTYPYTVEDIGDLVNDLIVVLEKLIWESK